MLKTLSSTIVIAVLLCHSSEVARAQDVVLENLRQTREFLRQANYRDALDMARRIESEVLAKVKAAPPSGTLARQLKYTPSDTDPSYLLVMVDEVEQMWASGDLMSTLRYAAALEKALYTETKRRAPGAKERLASWEDRIEGVGPRIRYQGLPLAAKLAYEAGDFSKAEAYARELLAAADREPKWPQGTARHYGHSVLGLIALRGGRVEEAKEHLRLSGKVPEDGTLGSFGPDLALARELLDRSEKTAVLEFLEDCRAFWRLENGRLAMWKQMIVEGKHPMLSGSHEKN